MLNKNIFLNHFLLRSNNFEKKFEKNIIKTKNVFKKFKIDYKLNKIPLLSSFEKHYKFDFNLGIIKKFFKYKNIVIIGMGGAILGTKSIYSFLGMKIKKKVFFFDNLDENLHIQFNKIKNIKNSCFVVISKSGNTLETITNLSMIFSKSLLKDKLIVITELKDSSLINIANEFDAEIIEHRDFIGGRYSVLSEVGMLPAALMGLNINGFKNLKKFIHNRSFVSSLIRNVASMYTLSSKGFKNSVILNYNSNLNDLGYWYQQLIGESLGKKGKGITPIVSPAPKDHHSVLQLYLDGPKDKFFTFFSSTNKGSGYKVPGKIIPSSMKLLKNKKLGSIILAQCNATKNIFKIKDIPFRHFVFQKNSEEELGMFFTFFILETILLARLMNVNPFDQPAVEQIKIETKNILLR